jgi:Fe-S oxidoreductase
LTTPIDVRRRVAGKAMLVEDFVDRFWDDHPRRPEIRAWASPVILHGHCHQKAVGGGDETSARLLRRLTDGNVTVLPSGCCGMAGSFGYDADKYDLSMAIGELSVFPPIRAADAKTTVCAPGTSCRHQIHDGTGRVARHPIDVAASLLCGDEENLR